MTDDNTGDFPPAEADNPKTGLRSPRVLGAIAAVAVLVLVVAGFVVTRGGDEQPAPTTSAVRRSTTTTTEKLPSGISEVAVVRKAVEEVNVLAAPPADWDSAGPSIVSNAIATAPPWSRDTKPERETIPSELEPVVGRYATPDGWRFNNPGPFENDQQLTFLVTERRGDWLKVLLPVRPNGTQGYISASDVDVTQTTRRIELHVGEHRLVAYDGPNRPIETTVVTGMENTPTPTGTFFVTDVITYKNPDGMYGPFALATNGYSETIDEFESGVPVIALHGTNRPEYMGQNRSNGCVRITNDIITQLADQFGQGTPVFIWP